LLFFSHFAGFVCIIISGTDEITVYFLNTQNIFHITKRMEAETEDDRSKEILSGLEDIEVPEALEDKEVLVGLGEADMENSRDIEETSIVEEKKAVDGDMSVAKEKDSVAGEEEADFGEGKEALLEEDTVVGDKETVLGGEKAYFAKEKTVTAIEKDEACMEELEAEEVNVGDEHMDLEETEAEKEVEPKRKKTEEDGGEGKDAVMEVGEAVRGQEESPELKHLDPNTLGKT
jgi:hypothetical protein